MASILERRIHKRLNVHLKARLLLPNGNECQAEICNISENGILFETIGGACKCHKLISCIDVLGRIEARVGRVVRDCFAVEFSGNRYRAFKIARAMDAVQDGKVVERASGATASPSASFGFAKVNSQ
jgi:hypothetical protein